MNAKNEAETPAVALSLPIARYRAVFRAGSAVRFGAFPGSAWRGAIGHALKRTVCVTRLPRCADCLLYRSCVYPYFYDTPPPLGAAKMRRYESAPHPFVLEPPAEPCVGDYLLGFTLVGQANRHLPLFLHALREAANGPRGVSRNRLELVRTEQEEEFGSDRWATIYEPDSALRPFPPKAPAIPLLPSGTVAIEIVTPLRVKREGRHVGPAEFRFADLFGSLLRRVSMLTEFHSEATLDVAFRSLSDAARQVPARIALEWQDLPRHSARQDTTMKLGGVVGRLLVETAALRPFWPFLWVGQWIHAGGAATMGLGRYRIASLQDAPVAPPAHNISAVPVSQPATR